MLNKKYIKLLLSGLVYIPGQKNPAYIDTHTHTRFSCTVTQKLGDFKQVEKLGDFKGFYTMFSGILTSF